MTHSNSSKIDIDEALFSVLREYNNETSNNKLHAALSYIEAMTKFIAVISISSVQKHDVEIYNKIFEDFKEEPSLGHYAGLIRKSFTSNVVESLKQYPLYEFLSKTINKKKSDHSIKNATDIQNMSSNTGSKKTIIDIADSVPSYRNTFLGHGAFIRDDEKDLLDDLNRNLGQIIFELEKAIDEIKQHIDFFYTPQTQVTNSPNQIEHSLHMRYQSIEYTISPLMQYIECHQHSCSYSHRNKIFFYNKGQKDRSSYLNYSFAHHEIIPGKIDIKNEQKGSSNLQGSSNPHRQNMLLSNFTGRENILQELSLFVTSAMDNKRSSYSVIGGSPGIGKSAFVTKFVENLKSNESYNKNLSSFIFYAKERQNYDLAVEIREHLFPQGGGPKKNESSFYELKSLFDSFIKENPNKRFLLVIDGLDEIPDPLELLQNIPFQDYGNIHIIISTQLQKDIFNLLSTVLIKNNHLNVLNKQNISKGNPSIEIGKLSKNEASNLLILEFPIEVTKNQGDYKKIVDLIYKSSEGLPLYLYHIIEQLQWNEAGYPAITNDQLKEIKKWAESLPEGIDEFYKQLINKDAMTRYILNIIYWCENGVRLDELYNFIKQSWSNEEIKCADQTEFEQKYFNAIRVYLTQDQNGLYSFYHNSMNKTLEQYHNLTKPEDEDDIRSQYIKYDLKESSELFIVLEKLNSPNNYHQDLTPFYTRNGLFFKIDEIHAIISRNPKSYVLDESTNTKIESIFSFFKEKPTKTYKEYSAIIRIAFISQYWDDYYALIRERDNAKIKDLFFNLSDLTDEDKLLSQINEIRYTLDPFLKPYFSKTIINNIENGIISNTETIQRLIPILDIEGIYKLLTLDIINQNIIEFIKAIPKQFIFFKTFIIFEHLSHRPPTSDIPTLDFNSEVYTKVIDFYKTNDTSPEAFQKLKRQKDTYLIAYALHKKTTRYLKNINDTDKYPIVHLLIKKLDYQTLLNDINEHFIEFFNIEIAEDIILNTKDDTKALELMIKMDLISNEHIIKQLQVLIHEKEESTKLFTIKHKPTRTSYKNKLITFYIENEKFDLAEKTINTIQDTFRRHAHTLPLSFKQRKFNDFFDLYFKTIKIRKSKIYLEKSLSKRGIEGVEYLLNNDQIEDLLAKKTYVEVYLFHKYKTDKDQFFKDLTKYYKQNSIHKTFFNKLLLELENCTDIDEIKKLDFFPVDEDFTYLEKCLELLIDTNNILEFSKRIVSLKNSDIYSYYIKEMINRTKNIQTLELLETSLYETIHAWGVLKKQLIKRYITLFLEENSYSKVAAYIEKVENNSSYIEYAISQVHDMQQAKALHKEFQERIEKSSSLSLKINLKYLEFDYPLEEAEQLINSYPIKTQDKPYLTLLFRKQDEQLSSSKFCDLFNKIKSTSKYGNLYKYLSESKDLQNTLEIVEHLHLDNLDQVIEEKIAFKYYNGTKSDIDLILEYIKDPKVENEINFKFALHQQKFEKAFSLLEEVASLYGINWHGVYNKRLADLICKSDKEDYFLKFKPHMDIKRHYTIAREHFSHIPLSRKMDLLKNTEKTFYINFVQVNITDPKLLSLSQRYIVHDNMFQKSIETELFKNKCLEKYFSIGNNQITEIIQELNTIKQTYLDAKQYSNKEEKMAALNTAETRFKKIQSDASKDKDVLSEITLSLKLDSDFDEINITEYQIQKV